MAATEKLTALTWILERERDREKEVDETILRIISNVEV
jgi:hypothetical protein